MKIIHSIFTFAIGGAETMLTDIINQQCKSASVNFIIVKKINPDVIHCHDYKQKP